MLSEERVSAKRRRYRNRGRRKILAAFARLWKAMDDYIDTVSPIPGIPVDMLPYDTSLLDGLPLEQMVPFVREGGGVWMCERCEPSALANPLKDTP